MTSPVTRPATFRSGQYDDDACYRLWAIQDTISDYHQLMGLPQPSFSRHAYQVDQRDMPGEIHYLLTDSDETDDYQS